MSNDMHRVLFLPSRIEAFVEEGSSVMQAFYKANLSIDAPCGGNGTCGKCVVDIILGEGVKKTVQACKTYVTEDITIDISQHATGHRILQGGTDGSTELNPMIKRVPVYIKKAKLGDYRSEWERLSEAVCTACQMPADELTAEPFVLSSLYQNLDDYDRKADVIICGREVLGVCPRETPTYAVAFDIGTTTVVGYLIDLISGEQLAVSSTLNPQSTYGADVVMRAKYAIERGVSPLAEAVGGALNLIIEELSNKVAISKKDIYLISVAGNTCMHHLFLGISPASLVYAPYNPVIRSGMILDASACGIEINPCAKLIAIPNIASFVGADTVSAILASEMDRSERLTLLIDIGTNGEIVLGNRNGMIACSTAAGPAFEGALVECGMRGANGAIDHVRLVDGIVDYTVIGGGQPDGICGSGLLDAIAQLLQVGLIDESGKLLDKSSTNEFADLCTRIRIVAGKKAFVFFEDAENSNGSSVYITQKDIREVQLAKGAIAAGIMLLTDEYGVAVNEIEQVLIAGAFGNYMSPESACQMSLIPPELENRIYPIGNAAGEGAKHVLLNSNEYERAKKISANCGYLELAAHPKFQDTFIDCLSFPKPASNIKF